MNYILYVGCYSYPVAKLPPGRNQQSFHASTPHRMLPFAFALIFAVQDTAPQVPTDTSVATPAPMAMPAPMVMPAPYLLPPADTAPRKRRTVDVEYSDWYNRRLTIHRWASYATIPLFIGQYLTGTELVNKGTDAPDWVKKTHPALATGVLVLFGTNTVTGLWNLWDARNDPNGRKWRTAHSILMLIADAGFAYTGAIAEDAKFDGNVRSRHKTAAIASGSIALISYAMMLSPFRQDK